MKKFLLIVLNTLVCTLMAAFIMINFINVLELDNVAITFDFSLLNRKPGYRYTLYLIGATCCFITMLAMLSTSSKKKADRDKKNFSHISSVHEAKKGLARVQFAKDEKERWEYNEGSKLAIMDKVFDLPKRGINGILTFFRVEDRRKLNTVRKWEINGVDKTMRAGLPVYMPRFRKKTMFLDVNDVHNLLIGTTNSGKSMSMILQMIETVRMSGECGVFNDPKGELYEYTAQQFKDDGYEVIRLNFVNPEASDDWGILQYVWDEYKKAYSIYREELEQWNEEGKNLSSGEKASWLIRKPEPDFSIAIEYLTDIASILTYEKNTDSAFWNDSAKDLIVGQAAYLMEECLRNEAVSEEMINFKSIKLAADIGDEPLTKQQASALGISAKTVMEALLELGRKPDDTSTINLNAYCKGAEQTKKSIKSVFNSKISILTMNEQIMRMTSKSSFDIKELGHKKMAIYLIVHDEKETYYPLVTMFIKQLYESVINEARGNKGRLPIPVNVIIDEAGNCPPFKNIAPMLTAGRSRGVRFTLAVQDTSQLVEKYGDHIATTIQNNCTNTVYLLGSQPETLKRFSEMCGNKQVWIPARQMYETRPLISVDRLQHMNLGEVVVHRQRKAPFITRMIPYNKCRFYKGKTADPNEKKPKKRSVPWLNLKMLLNEYGSIFQ